MWLIGDIIYKLRPRLFWQVCITKLIVWSFYTLCMSEPTSQTFTFKCELYLTLHGTLSLDIWVLLVIKVTHLAVTFQIATLGILMSYASPSVWKLHHRSDITFQLYKPAFHSSHLSCNMSYSSIATIQIFCLLQWRYFYSTQFSMMELLLSVSQHWKLCLG